MARAAAADVFGKRTRELADAAFDATGIATNARASNGKANDGA